MVLAGVELLLEASRGPADWLVMCLPPVPVGLRTKRRPVEAERELARIKVKADRSQVAALLEFADGHRAENPLCTTTFSP